MIIKSTSRSVTLSLGFVMSRAVFVVGAHRSGTSAIAGALHKIGVNMGEPFLQADAHNPRGYYEDVVARSLNQAMIGRWDNPQMQAPTELVSAVRAHIRYRQSGNPDVWGLKDPRFSFTLPVWARAMRDMCPENTLLIIEANRRWSDSAMSIVSRGKSKDFEAAERVVKLYHVARSNSLHEVYHMGYTMSTLKVPFDFLLGDPVSVLDRIADFVGVKLTPEAIQHIDRRISEEEEG